MQYSKEDRIPIVQCYYDSGKSLVAARRKLRLLYGETLSPSDSTILRLLRKFESAGFTGNRPKNRTRTARTEGVIEGIRRNLEAHPRTSIRHRRQQLNLSYTTLQRALRKDLRVKAYKSAKAQAIKATDPHSRLVFANWIAQKEAEDPRFCEKVLFSDGAHFHPSGYVNEQNQRMWAERNPREVVQCGMKPEKCTAWCALWAGGVLGPYFFEDEQGNSVTVNGSRYRDMLSNFLFPAVEDLGVEGLWFQQNGATCHTAEDSIRLLSSKFLDRLISGNGTVAWPPRSCDLTPLDFFFWGYIKDKVYAENPTTILDLKQSIRQVCSDLDAATCK